jgi:hypothetical protein
MKRLCLTLGMLGLVALALAAQAEAQTQPATPQLPGTPAVKRGGKVFNPANITVMSGTVTAINRSVPQSPDQPVQVGFTLQSPLGPIRVMMGPASFVDQQPVQIAAGDVVEVTGWLVTRGRKSRLIAGQVKKGNQVLRLRNEQGQPLWQSSP